MLFVLKSTTRIEIVFIVVLFVVLIIGGCKLKSNLEQTKKTDSETVVMDVPMEEIITKEPEIKEYTGELIEEPFVNKAGRVIPNVGDLFFKVNGQKHFVKLMEGKVLRVDLEKYYNKTVKIKGYLTEGLWDTDNPEVQSRIGEYMVVLEIL